MQKLLDPRQDRKVGGPPLVRLVRRRHLKPNKRVGVPCNPLEQLESLLAPHPLDSGGDGAEKEVIFLLLIVERVDVLNRIKQFRRIAWG